MAGSGILVQNTAVSLAVSAYNADASATATALTAGINEVTASAADTDSVILPAGQPRGSVIYVFNRDASQDIKVWPNTGATMNGGTASTAAVTVGQTQGLICVQAGTDGLTWLCFLGAVCTAS